MVNRTSSRQRHGSDPPRRTSSHAGCGTRSRRPRPGRTVDGRPPGLPRAVDRHPAAGRRGVEAVGIGGLRRLPRSHRRHGPGVQDRSSAPAPGAAEPRRRLTRAEPVPATGSARRRPRSTVPPSATAHARPGRRAPAPCHRRRGGLPPRRAGPPPWSRRPRPPTGGPVTRLLVPSGIDGGARLLPTAGPPEGPAWPAGRS